MAVDSPVRPDLDTVEKQLLDMLANGQDGVEAGFKTTEFWLSVASLAADYFVPGQISPQERLLAATVIVAAYAGFRTWRKNGGPARLIAQLIALRKAAIGH